MARGGDGTGGVGAGQVQAGVPRRPVRGQDQHHHPVHVRQVRQHLPGNQNRKSYASFRPFERFLDSCNYNVLGGGIDYLNADRSDSVNARVLR